MLSASPNCRSFPPAPTAVHRLPSCIFSSVPGSKRTRPCSRPLTRRRRPPEFLPPASKRKAPSDASHVYGRTWPHSPSCRAHSPALTSPTVDIRSCASEKYPRKSTSIAIEARPLPNPGPTARPLPTSPTPSWKHSSEISWLRIRAQLSPSPILHINNSKIASAPRPAQRDTANPAGSRRHPLLFAARVACGVER